MAPGFDGTPLRSARVKQTEAHAAAPRWHGRSADDALAALEATLAGLSASAAATRLDACGPNRLREPPGRSGWRVEGDPMEGARLAFAGKAGTETSASMPMQSTAAAPRNPPARSRSTPVVMEIFHLFFVRNIQGASPTWKAVRGTKVVWLTVRSSWSRRSRSRTFRHCRRSFERRQFRCSTACSSSGWASYCSRSSRSRSRSASGQE